MKLSAELQPCVGVRFLLLSEKHVSARKPWALDVVYAMMLTDSLQCSMILHD